MSGAPTLSTWLTSEGKSIASEGTPLLLHPGDILDGWRVLSFIARGGNAEVYRAEHTELKTIAAIKISIADTSESHARFKQEAQILGSVHHEALPVFHAFGEKNGHAYIITEFLQPLELPRTDLAVALFATQIANALGVLHAQGIVHRDIKPGNITTRNGHDPVLVDLGYAKRIATTTVQQQSISIEQSRLVGLGTPGYAAPEQFTGEEITPASDIHALGVMLNECFGGKPPRHWKRIIAKCTSSLPDYRFHSAQEFIQAIRHRNLQRMLFWTLCSILALGLIAAFAIIPAITHRRAQEKAREEERQRREENVRLAQESLMREVQLIMDEK
ncbi:MAG: serine/threonine protein kinase [bacterium]|nr:serine/threonine protein kinase [Candidatus Colisoma equi]